MFDTIRPQRCFAGWMVILGIAAAAVNAQAPPSTRELFRHAISDVERRMSPDDVRDLLGPPDEIRTPFTPGGLQRDNIKERWCYGVVSAGGFPTLGYVDFDWHDRVLSTRGDVGTPIAPGTLDEAKLRRVLTAIDRVPNVEFEHRERHYNPLDMIQIVNALQPLGRDGALAVLDEYLRVAPDARYPRHSNVVLVALTLFEHQADDPALTRIIWDEHRATFPHYPIVIWQDVPLFMFPLGGYGRTGPMPDYGRDLELFRTHGKLREKPLAPPDDVLGILADFEHSPLWFVANEEEQSYQSDQARQLVMNQLLWLVETAYPVKITPNRMKISYGCNEPDVATQWQVHLREFPKFNIRWDDAKQLYVQGDGTTLMRWRNIYDRNIWDLTRPGASITLTIERRTPEYVVVSLSCVFGSTVIESAGGTIEVFSADDPIDVLATFDYPGGGQGSGSRMSSSGFLLPEGRIIQVRVVEADGKVAMSSPIYEP